MPPSLRCQLGGVNNNWGKNTLAHVAHLAGLLNAVTEATVVRNVVGNTHEDIDGLFGVIKRKFGTKDMLFVSQFEETVAEAFLNFRLPVRIVDVDTTRDYIAFYDPHIDPELSGFGYSVHIPGYHVAKFTYNTT